MQRLFPLFLLLGTLGITSPQAHAQPAAPKGSVDGIINWDNPWDLTEAKFKEIAEALPKKKSERAYNTRVISAGQVRYSIGQGFGADSGGGKINLFNGTLQVDSVTVVFEADKTVSISFGIGVHGGTNARKPSSKDFAKLKAELARVTGDASPKPYDYDVGGGYPPVVSQLWTHRNYKVRLSETYLFPASKGPGTGLGVFHMVVLPLNAK